ncbi:MAG: SH3 domain-containing protein [Betaproteobacteria bacterium]|jgi:hypothetical protein
MNARKWLAALLPALAAATALAQGPATPPVKGVTLQALDLKEKPFIDAGAVGQLAAQSPVTVLARQGGWLQVKADRGQGWVRLLSVRLGSPDPVRNESFTAMLFNSTRRGSSPTTVTTGVRGFSEEDLKQAQPAPDELRKMDGFAAGANPAAFAASGGLAPRAVPYRDGAGRTEGEQR